ncbi:sensor histidine kinase [Sphingobacterium alkalisoli]|nr:HAMP domain-containing sensor histidine kinase [Sphingobacterium alkalisoli]
MQIKANPIFYKGVLIGSMLALIALLTVLVYNTYKLKDDNLLFVHKQKIVAAYGNYVKNDKLFPGGDVIFREVFEYSLPDLIAIGDSTAFYRNGDALVRRLLGRLRESSPMDSLFYQIVVDNGLERNLLYRLSLDRFEVAKGSGNEWNTIFDSKDNGATAVISGNLLQVNTNNRILELSINDHQGEDYRFTYSLYVDSPNRVWKVLSAMAPVFFASLICVLIIIVISYATFRNWINERKEGKLKTDFLQHIRHEFNTPITTILVSASNLKEGEKLAIKDVREMGHIIERHAKRLKTYVKQSIDSVMLEDQNPDFELLDINQLTITYLSDIALSMTSQIAINYDPYKQPIYVDVDPMLYFPILNNLVENANKFNFSEDKNINLRWEKLDGDWIRLYIWDNGMGIREVDRSRIFDKFYRSATKQTVAGLGLGLYYVKISAEKMGWIVRLDNTTRIGACFEIDIPLKK